MTQEKQHDIALMRYSVISPIINGLSEEYSSLDAFYRDAAKKGAVAPDGTVKHFSAATIERWYRNADFHTEDTLREPNTTGARGRGKTQKTGCRFTGTD